MTWALALALASSWLYTNREWLGEWRAAFRAQRAVQGLRARRRRGEGAGGGAAAGSSDWELEALVLAEEAAGAGKPKR